jgi:hypothetical protein
MQIAQRIVLSRKKVTDEGQLAKRAGAHSEAM